MSKRVLGHDLHFKKSFDLWRLAGRSSGRIREASLKVDSVIHMVTLVVAVEDLEMVSSYLWTILMNADDTNISSGNWNYGHCLMWDWKEMKSGACLARKQVQLGHTGYEMVIQHLSGNSECKAPIWVWIWGARTELMMYISVMCAWVNSCI